METPFPTVDLAFRKRKRKRNPDKVKLGQILELRSFPQPIEKQTSGFVLSYREEVKKPSKGGLKKQRKRARKLLLQRD